ncbi:hypothetical protein L6255_03215 [Candidatus Parcubacteria bacterium]|nr:hypothetical protein [Patescibacteria group bacterium]MCG2689422.1 hypothetical protein [Candidatus Parcubacteria bacterium]
MVTFDLFIRAVTFLGFLFVEVYKLRNNLVLKNSEYKVATTPFNQTKFLGFYKKMDRAFFLILLVQVLTPYPQVGSFFVAGFISTAVRAILAILFCIATILYFVSREQLGVYWTPAGCVKQDHKLINFGIFKYEKHPIYAMYFLMMLFSQLAFFSFGVLFPIFTYLRYRALAILEESILKKELGGYTKYARETKSIFLI